MSGFDFSLFARGGPVMWVLAALAIIGLMLFVERTLYLHRGQIPSSKAFLQGIKNALAKRRRLPVGAGDSKIEKVLENEPAPSDDDTALFDQEYERDLFHWAAEQVQGEFRDRSWQAFWRTTVSGEKIATVADELKMSIGAIYIARSRVMTRLKQRIDEVQGKSST